MFLEFITPVFRVFVVVEASKVINVHKTPGSCDACILVTLTCSSGGLPGEIRHPAWELSALIIVIVAVQRIAINIINLKE